MQYATLSNRGSLTLKHRQHHRVVFIALFFIFFSGFTGQQVHAQFYAVKTDMLGLATTNLNMDVSATINSKWSLHLPVTYNPWTFSNNRKIKQLTFQPGVRYWRDQPYGYGWFWGANAIVSQFNIGNLPGSKHRYEGKALGAGVSTGFSLPLHTFWNLEFEAGVGGVLTQQKKFLCPRCGDMLGRERKFYVVPTKLSVSLVYLF